jgi:hypothetical protein
LRAVGDPLLFSPHVNTSQMQRAQEAVERTQAVLNQCEARLLREIHRFKEDKATDLRRIVNHYIKLQCEHSKRLEHAWSTLLEEEEAAQPPPVVSHLPPPPPAVQQQHQVDEFSAAASDGLVGV